MMAMGGGVRGGIYGTAPNLQSPTGNPTLENSGSDVPLRDRLPIGLREGHRQLARRRFGVGPRRELQGRSSPAIL